MRFAAPIAGCVHGKWKLEYHVVWHWLHSDRPRSYIREMIWKKFFTFDFHILPWQWHIGARIIPCRCIKKKIPLVDPFTCLLAMNRNRLELSDCGRKIRNDIHTDTYYCKPKLVSWRQLNITVFYTRFLSPTDRKYAESSTYWQFLDYRPPVNFDRCTYAKVWCKELDIYIYIYITLSIIDKDFVYR